MRARTFGYTFEQRSSVGGALNGAMKALIAALLLAVAAAAHAQPRVYQQAELDALLAPIALYPDPLLSQVLIAATYPDDVREAAAWLRANPNLRGDEAVRAAEPMPWDPSVKALLAYPDLLARMDESPQWTTDLGHAFIAQEPQVMETVQVLRRRAQASGHLQSDGYQSVQEHDSYVVVQPVYSGAIYVPWYNPLVVYGPWWWHSHRPIAWRPWHPRPLVITRHVHRPVIDWHHRHIKRVHVHRPVRVHRPVQVHRPAHLHRPAPQVHRPARIERPATIHNHVHQAQTARPIIQGARIQSQETRIQGRGDIVRQHRAMSRGEFQQGSRGELRQGSRDGGQGRGGGHGGGRGRK